MIQKLVLSVGVIVGLAGCAHKSEPMSSQQTDAMATTMASTMPASESLMDRAKDLIKKGEALLAKGKSDNDPTEQSEGQKLIDEGKALIQKYKLFGS